MSEYKLKGTDKAEKAVKSACQKIEDVVLASYQKIEDTAVGVYQKVEDTVVGSYKNVEHKFVDTFLERVNDDDTHPDGEQETETNFKYRANTAHVTYKTSGNP